MDTATHEERNTIMEPTRLGELPPFRERPRMNDAQRDALRDVCSRYHVEFREDDYLVHAPDATFSPGYAEGWVGGSLHAAGNPHSTIYVGVDPDGRINS